MPYLDLGKKKLISRRVELQFDPSLSYSVSSGEWLLAHNWDGYWSKLDGFQMVASVTAANNSLNYWTIRIFDYANATLMTVTTQGWAANSPTQFTIGGYAGNIDYGVRIQFIKSLGSPGNFRPVFAEMKGVYVLQ
jgi:hypothetical protein